MNFKVGDKVKFRRYLDFDELDSIGIDEDTYWKARSKKNLTVLLAEKSQDVDANVIYLKELSSYYWLSEWFVKKESKQLELNFNG